MSPAVTELIGSATVLQALTLQQPWAWAVVDRGKDVENRIWAPPRAVVGKLLAIHAGLAYDARGAESLREHLGELVPGPRTCQRGTVVAVVVVKGFTRSSRSQWAVPGQIHWLLGEVVRLPRPVPARGAQGIWELAPAALAEVKAQLLPGQGPRAQAVSAEKAAENFTLQLVPPMPPAAPAPERRLRQRTWNKGSARGVGGPVRASSVYVESSKLVECPNCKRWWYGPGIHAPRYARGAPEDWPHCLHGFGFLADCVGHAVPPECCATPFRIVMAHRLLTGPWSQERAA